MRNTVLLFMFCCVFPFGMWAQTEFSQTGAKWKTQYFRSGGYYNVYEKNHYVYELKEDTLIGNKICKKLSMDEVVVGAFLEEERKVWYYPLSNIESTPERVLLYDFSKEKGDTITSYQIPRNTGGCLLDMEFTNLGMNTLKVEDVYYQFGRKVMVVSDNSYGQDIWIEGVGSPSGFWGAYLLCITDGSHMDMDLLQTLAPDGTVIYYKGLIRNPDYHSTFLKEGKTWEIENTQKGIDKITIGVPQMINDYPSYPVYKNGVFEESYLYDVNGNIYWIFNSYGGILANDYWLYSFDFIEGDNVYLCVGSDIGVVYYRPPRYECYKVTQVDTVECKGYKINRVVLDGTIHHVWLENIGSLNTLLYITSEKDYQKDIPQCKLLRCYIGDEMLYDSSDFPDGIEGLSSSVPTYLVVGGKLTVTGGAGYQLSLYDINGREVYDRKLTEMIETISLSDLSPTLLIGKLQKGESVLSFKTRSFGK